MNSIPSGSPFTQDEACALNFFKRSFTGLPGQGSFFVVLSSDASTNLQFAQFRNIHFSEIPLSYRSDLPNLVKSLWEKTQEALMESNAGPEDLNTQFKNALDVAEKVRRKGYKWTVFVEPQARLLADYLEKTNPH
jgi:hypothetical protein